MARNFQPLFSYKEQKMEQSNNVYKEYIPRIKACKLLRDLCYSSEDISHHAWRSRSSLLPQGGESVIRQFLAHNDGILSSWVFEVLGLSFRGLSFRDTRSSIASSKTFQCVILYLFFCSSLFPAQNSLSKMRSRLSPLEWHKVTEWRCKLELNTEYSAIKKQLTEAHGGSDLLNDSRFKILMKC